MKKIVIFSLLVLIILIFSYNFDRYKEKYFPEYYYSNRVKKLEEELAVKEKSIKFHYDMFKSAEKSAQKDYYEYLDVLIKTEPNVNKDSLEVKAKKFISDHVKRFATLLQNVIDERNKIYHPLL